MELVGNALARMRSRLSILDVHTRALVPQLSESRWFVPAVIVASLLLCAPTLRSGLIADDFIHRLVLSEPDGSSGHARHWLDLFHFTSPERNPALVADGTLPWWSDPELRIAFFRPLSALTHALDFALFPDSPALMHLHSLLWSAAALIAVWALYRQAFQRTTPAAIAVLFYALDPTRAMSVGWLASRNALIALCLSALSITAYLRGRQGRPWARLLSPVLLGLAMLSGEGAAAGLAYLVAAALFLDPRPALRSILGLVPHGLVAALVLFLGHVQSYGVEGSGGYLDPRHDPVAYLAAMPERAVTVLMAALTGLSADISKIYDLLLPGLSTVVRWISLAVIGLCMVVCFPLVRRSKTARFFATGAALSLLPATVAAPNDRLLGWLLIGTTGLFAECVDGALQRNPARQRVERLAVPAVLGLHLGLAPLLLCAQVDGITLTGDMMQLADDALPRSGDVSDKIAVFVNAPEDPLVAFVPAMRAATGTPKPAAVRRLAAGFSSVAIRRTGPRTLEVTQENGFLHQHTEQLTRNVAVAPFTPGDRRAVRGMTVEVLETLPDGRPLRVAFTFDEPLESDRYLFRAATDSGYAPFEPPSVGACTELPAPSIAALFFGQHEGGSTRWLQQLQAGDLQPSPCDQTTGIAVMQSP